MYSVECGVRSFPHRHGDATGKPKTRDETRGCKKRAFRARLPPILIFSTRYQTGWNVTKCHACHAKRHDNLLGHIRIGGVFQLPQTRRRRRKTSDSRQDTYMQKNHISYETSSNFHSWQHDKRTSFAASPIDTARPQENQRPETRQVGAPKRAFRARLPPIFTLCSFKIDVFLRLEPENLQPQNRCFVRGFRPFSAHRTKCKMPRLPRNLHLVAT